MGSCTMLVALQMQQAKQLSVMKGRDSPVIFSAVLTMRCSVLRYDIVQLQLLLSSH